MSVKKEVQRNHHYSQADPGNPDLAGRLFYLRQFVSYIDMRLLIQQRNQDRNEQQSKEDQKGEHEIVWPEGILIRWQNP